MVSNLKSHPGSNEYGCVRNIGEYDFEFTDEIGVARCNEDAKIVSPVHYKGENF